MTAIVREPPEILLNKCYTSRRSCIGNVRVASDCLNKHPSCSSATSVRFAILLSCTKSHPMAVEALDIRNAVRICCALTCRLLANSTADSKLFLRIVWKYPNNVFKRSLDCWLAIPAPMVQCAWPQLRLALCHNARFATGFIATTFQAILSESAIESFFGDFSLFEEPFLISMISFGCCRFAFGCIF